MRPQYEQERKLSTEGFPSFLKDGIFMERHNHLDEVTLRNVEIQIEEICMTHRLFMKPVKIEDLYDKEEGRIVFRAELFEDPAHCDIFFSIIKYESFANFITLKPMEPVERIYKRVEVK